MKQKFASKYKINNQFTAIMEKVNEILFIYDRTKKHLLQIRWFNSLSYKMNAVLFKQVGYSSNRLINILGRFTFNNKPIKLIMSEYDLKILMKIQMKKMMIMMMIMN